MNKAIPALGMLLLLAPLLRAQELRQGPYGRLVIRGAMVIPGHGGPAYGPADVVIEPDVTGIDLTEFVRAEELARIGEAATVGQIPMFQQLLTRLDPQLFRQFGDARPPG